MAQRLKIGDRVSWNSEAGRLRGKIVPVHTKNVNYKGYIHHASKDEPQYEIKSEKTAHIALHKGRVLRRLTRARALRATVGLFSACHHWCRFY
jgi:Hypervirulence associated proteins TUDOR domain